MPHRETTGGCPNILPRARLEPAPALTRGTAAGCKRTSSSAGGDSQGSLSGHAQPRILLCFQYKKEKRKKKKVL